MTITRDKEYKLIFGVYVFSVVSILFIYLYEFNMSISRALLMNSPVVILMLLALISTGRTFILDESGCTIRFWKFQKKYTWDQLKTKRIEKFDSPPIITGAFSCYYLTEAVLCPHKIHKPKFVRPSTYGIIHPFSCVYINFNLCNDKWQRG